MVRWRKTALAGAAGVAIAVSLAVSSASDGQAAARHAAAAAGGARLTAGGAAKPSFRPRGPAVAADRRGHQIYVFWASPKGVLEEAWSPDGVAPWHDASLPRMGTLYSQPSVVTTIQDQSGGHSWIYVFWEGAGKHGLFMAYYNGKWHGAFKVFTGPMNSDPSASLAVTGGDDEMIVAWTGTNGRIWYTRSTTPAGPHPNGRWVNTFATPKEARSGPFNEGPVPGSESPAATGSCRTDHFGCRMNHFYWRDKHTGFLDTGTYQAVNNSWTDGPAVERKVVLGSDPSATENEFSAGVPTIAWRGAQGGGKLWLWDQGTSGAPPVARPECGALGSAPAIVFSPTWKSINPLGPVFMFWKGDSRNTVYEAYESSSGLHCPVNGISRAPVGGDPATKG
jgi:hypothetical protein